VIGAINVKPFNRAQTRPSNPAFILFILKGKDPDSFFLWLASSFIQILVDHYVHLVIEILPAFEVNNRKELLKTRRIAVNGINLDALLDFFRTFA
jgi:hypothetical protein